MLLPDGCPDLNTDKPHITEVSRTLPLGLHSKASRRSAYLKIGGEGGRTSQELTSFLSFLNGVCNYCSGGLWETVFFLDLSCAGLS